MRKWHYVAAATAIAVSVAGYWWFSSDSTGPNPDDSGRRGFSKLTKQVAPNAGNTEESETIEPLIVDHGSAPAIVPPVIFSGPIARTTWNPETNQPPRPDAKRRMPYADEAPVVAPVFDPIVWILESSLPELKLFDPIRDADPTEESEPREIAPPIWHPHAYPHCPYTGGCPAPSRFPLVPRD